MTITPSDTSIVFAITDHKYTGLTLDIYTCTMNGKVASYARAHKEEFSNLTGATRNLAGMIADMRPDAITIRFSKGRQTAAVFFKSLEPQYFTKIIRPAIEKQFIKALKLCKEHNIPLYFADRLGNLTDSCLTFSDSKADVVFSFKLESNKLLYRLKVSLPEKSFPLTSGKVTILTLSPCYIMTNGQIVELSEGDGKKLLPFQKNEYIEIQERQLEIYLKSFVAKAIANYKTELEGIPTKIIAGEPVTKLTLYIDWQQQPIATLTFTYNNITFAADDKSQKKVVLNKSGGYSFTITERNILTEQLVKEYLQKLGFRYKSGSAWQLTGAEKDVPAFIYRMNNLYANLKIAGILVESQMPDNYHFSGYDLHKIIKKENDWFDVYMEVKIGEFNIPFTAFHQHILDNNSVYFLPDRSIFLIPQEWFHRFGNLLALSRRQGQKYRVGLYHAGLLQDSMPEDTLNDLPDYKSIAQSIADNHEVIKAGSWSLLRNYQQTGVKWMLAMKAFKTGGILADDMGLGKTIQVLVLLAHLKNTGNYPSTSLTSIKSTGQLDLFGQAEGISEVIQIKTSLIVLPLSLIGNWESETRRFAPHLSFYEMTGINRNTDPAFLMQFDLVFTTYKTLVIESENLKASRFFYLVLDESQNIKNASTQAYRAAIEIAAEYRLCLSGTPIENSLNDLWSQMNLLNHGLLGSNAVFGKRFINAIEKNKDAEQQEILRRIIKPFILRRTKNEVASELPELTEQTIVCEMTEDQQQLYETRKSEIRNYLTDKLVGNNDTKNRFVVLSSLMKLRLLACHPGLTEKTYAGNSGKFDQICEMISEIVSEGHKILVFSQFVKHLAFVAGYLVKENISFVKLTGEQNQIQRQKAIDEFSNPDGSSIFLITLKAGGTGLNLTQADYVFLLDPWWNPAAESQAINRAHRIGQHKQVIAYRFITKDSIEEKIQKLQTKKQNLADLFVNSNTTGSFNIEEIKELLD
jgi:SNF2 family DNA or RNA helicase